jgi:hypothetical protein
MNMKRVVFVIGIIILLSGVVLADFSLSTTKDSFSVVIGSTQEIDLNISSTIDDILSINVNPLISPSGKSWVTLSDSALHFNAGESKIVKAYLSPPEDVIQTSYTLRFTVQSSSTGEKNYKDVYITISKGDIVGVIEINVTGNTEPTGTLSISFLVRNVGTVPINGIKVYCDVFSPKEEEIATATYDIEILQPGESKNLIKTIKLEAGAIAGTYKIVVKTATTKGIMDSDVKYFVVPSKAVIEYKNESFTSLIGPGKRIIVTNNGNKISDTIEIRENLGLLSMFYQGQVPTSKEGDVYIFSVGQLRPGESAIITYEINYLLAAVVIIVIVMLAWFILYKFKTVQIRKYIIQKKEIEEGEEFTVGIDIRNNTGRYVSNVVVKDFVPGAFKVKPGTGLKPKIKKTYAGVELIWNLNELKNREERLLNYKIVPIFGVSGQLRLPKASVNFNLGRIPMQNKSFVTYIGVRAKKD